MYWCFRRLREEAPERPPTELPPHRQNAMEEPEATALDADTDKTEERKLFRGFRTVNDRGRGNGEGCPPSMLTAGVGGANQHGWKYRPRPTGAANSKPSKTEAKT